MLNLQLGPAEILTTIAMSTAIVVAIWHAAMYIGRLTVQVNDHGRIINGHDARLNDHDDELRYLKGIR